MKAQYTTDNFDRKQAQRLPSVEAWLQGLNYETHGQYIVTFRDISLPGVMYTNRDGNPTLYLLSDVLPKEYRPNKSMRLPGSFYFVEDEPGKRRWIVAGLPVSQETVEDPRYARFHPYGPSIIMISYPILPDFLWEEPYHKFRPFLYTKYTAQGVRDTESS